MTTILGGPSNGQVPSSSRGVFSYELASKAIVTDARLDWKARLLGLTLALTAHEHDGVCEVRAQTLCHQTSLHARCVLRSTNALVAAAVLIGPAVMLGQKLRFTFAIGYGQVPA